MRNVHYFPRYSQKENVVTNNTLLLLLRLMDYSRSKFELFLGKLAGEADLEFSPSWLHISQQRASKSTVVDGYIAQDSIKIIVETKLTAGFDVQQLEGHLSIFRQEDHRLLVLLRPSIPMIDPGLKDFCSRARAKRVDVLATTFERIVAVMKEALTDRDDEMYALLDDFVAFCAEAKLLSDDRYYLFTPPCGPSHKDNEELRLYYCPAERNRRSAGFLGIYADKTVRAIGKIAKVVSCEIDIEHGLVEVVEGDSLTEAEKTRVLRAASLAPNHDWDIQTGHRFFLCDDWAQTSFRKATPGGIMGHRMLDLRKELPFVPTTVKEIAEALDGLEWKQG